MKMRIGITCAFVLLAAGCASHWSRSYSRWEKLQGGTGERATWAQCIDQRSSAYLNREKPDAKPKWFKGDGHYYEVIFTWVLADCSDKMTGSAWRHTQPDEYERLIGDAYQHFFGVAAEIQSIEDNNTI